SAGRLVPNATGTRQWIGGSDEPSPLMTATGALPSLNASAITKPEQNATNTAMPAVRLFQGFFIKRRPVLFPAYLLIHSFRPFLKTIP
ncbi:MAG: hypothetical protein ACI9UN_004570, partial [Granulosicoccus sp.]